jgi:hypothetical protein
MTIELLNFIPYFGKYRAISNLQKLHAPRIFNKGVNKK